MPGGRWQSGEIRFDSLEELDGELETFIAKGAVRMSGPGQPEPLAPFEFRLVIPTGSSVRLRGMIVSQAGGLALVQILDFSQAVAGRIRAARTLPPGAELADPAPVHREPEPPSPLVLKPARSSATAPPPAERRRSVSSAPETPWSGPEPRPATMPPPTGKPPSKPSTAPPGGAPPGGAPTARPRSPTAQPPPGEPPASSRPRSPTAQPPPGEPPASSRPHSPTAQPPPGEPPASSRPRSATIRPPLGEPRAGTQPPPFLRPTGSPTGGALPGTIPGEAFDDPLTWATPRAATGVFPLVGGGPLAGFAGTLLNPQGLDGLLTLPLGPIGAVRDIERISAVGLLRFLGARRASGTLIVRGTGGGERTLLVDRGAFLLSSQERDTLRPIFQWPEGSFEFEPGVPTMTPQRVPVSAWRIVLDAVKLMVREAPMQDLAARLDGSRGVKLTAAFTERARTLDLAPGEERLVRRDLDGRLTLREIYRLGGLSELNVQRLVFTLLALGLVEMTEAEGIAAPVVDEVREQYQRLVGADLFSALGVHWSDAPERLPAAYETMRQRYGAGSPGAASSPTYAGKILELVERANVRLRDRSGRRAYRTELAVDVRHAAALLAAQVPIAKARGEIRKATELLSAARDLFDNPAWDQLHAELTGR